MSVKKLFALLCAVCLCSNMLFAADDKSGKAAVPPKPATDITAKQNADVLKELPFKNKQDFEDAKRGLIASPAWPIMKEDGSFAAFDIRRWDFIKQGAAAPDSVNPSLWRIAQINMNSGLFKVTDKFYQIRGMDLANMNIIEGNTGLIIMDPLTNEETSKAGLELYRKSMKSDKPVVAVIFTHSHTDHYGGVRGVIDEADAKSGKVKVIAPDRFLEETASENVYAGTALTRRVMYAYGQLLEAGPMGHVDSGLGKSMGMGKIGLIAPNDIIKQTGEKRSIDGIDMVFQMAPGTEAPAEFMVYFPQFKLFCAAEDVTHNIHNIYTLRGAQVRDAKVWWKTINESLDLFPDMEIIVAQHQWPTWGKENVQRLIKGQRDQIKYIHDQALNLANKGYTMNEIGDMVKLPKSLDQMWFNRGYYGSVNHNARGIYNKYLGYYSGNPAELHQLPPVDTAKKMVEYMGGEAAMIDKAKQDFKDGNYRWVAQVMNYVVFANPNNREAALLEADALEQLGYQTENATWRDNYLMGANELRNGKPQIPATFSTLSPDTIKALTVDLIFDYLGIKINAKAVDGKKILMNFEFTDTKEKYAVELENSVFAYTMNRKLPNADVSISMTLSDLQKVVAGTETFASLVKSGAIKLSGNKKAFDNFDSYFENFDILFNIVTP